MVKIWYKKSQTAHRHRALTMSGAGRAGGRLGASGVSGGAGRC